jgi:integrase
VYRQVVQVAAADGEDAFPATFQDSPRRRRDRLEALQHVLGHATIVMTQRYGRLSDEYVRREADRDAGELASNLASRRR